jgi:hypothetical protein
MPQGGPELHRGKGIGVQAGNSQLYEGDEHVQVTDTFMLTKDTSTYFAGKTLDAIS